MRRSCQRTWCGSARRVLRLALLGGVCALGLQGLPMLAAADVGEAVVGSEAATDAVPATWYEDYRRALGSDALAGATVGVAVFALLMGLYSALTLLRGQHRQRQVLDTLGREPTPSARPRAASTHTEVLEPMVGQPARSPLDDLDLVIEPIETKPATAAEPSVVEAKPATAPAPPAMEPTQPRGSVKPRPAARPVSVSAPDRDVPQARAMQAAPTRPADDSVLLDPDADLPVSRAAEPMDAEGRICQCFALLAEGRFEEAVEVTGQGLAGHPDAGRVFGQLARVASLLGRHDDAIHLAARAYRAEPSEERFEQLLRLRSAAHRFEPREGDRLRRAVAYNPEQPVYLRALGIFEALHGNVETARRLLRAALRHETGEETRGAIARELLQLERRGDEARSDEPPREGARAGLQ